MDSEISKIELTEEELDEVSAAGLSTYVTLASSKAGKLLGAVQQHG